MSAPAEQRLDAVPWQSSTPSSDRWRRAHGITADQIARYDLPRKPRKVTDRRALHVKDSVEAEAMPANILRSIMRERIEALLPDGALQVAKVAEASERAGLLRLASHCERDV